MTEARILNYGVNKQLRSSRALVFESAGYFVYSAEELEEAKRILTMELIDLLVLCSSLSTEQYDHAAFSARQFRREIKILAMSAEKASYLTVPQVEVFSEEFVSPVVLLSRVSRILGNGQISIRT